MKQEAPNLHANCIRLQSRVLLQLAIAGNMRCYLASIGRQFDVNLQFTTYRRAACIGGGDVVL